jgi:hypothetical protein
MSASLCIHAKSVAVQPAPSEIKVEVRRWVGAHDGADYDTLRIVMGQEGEVSIFMTPQQSVALEKLLKEWPVEYRTL